MNISDDIRKENVRRQYALNLLSEGLKIGNRHYSFEVSDDGRSVYVTDDRSGSVREVNVNGDNIPAMFYDVMRNCLDWFM
jgi:hypothetical protein